MNKRDALKLKPGDRIIYGDHWQGQRVQRYRHGQVRFVTQRGGIKLTDGRWVPYHFVVRKQERAAYLR
jgi:hypothetical protein